MGKIISIDISTDSIILVEAEKMGKNVKVHKTLKVMTPTNAVDDGLIRDKDSVAGVIETILNENKIKAKSVIFTVSSSKVVTREVSLPYATLNKLESVVNLNASEYFPFNINEYIIDQKVIDITNTAGKKELRVLIAAAPSTLVSEYSELARQIGLKVHSVDFSGNSIYQIIKRQSIQGNYIVIGFDYQSTLVTIMEGNKLILQRAVPYGTEELYKATMSRFGISFEEAIEMIGQKPLVYRPEDVTSGIQDEVAGAMNLILGGVNRIIDYYNSRNQEKIFDKIFIYGNGTQIHQIDKSIEKFFGMSTVVIESFINVTFHKNFTSSFNPILSITAIGALFEPYNLKPEQGETALGKKDLILYGVLAGLSVAALVAYMVIPSIKGTSLKSQKKSLVSKIEQIKEVEEIVTVKETLEKQGQMRSQVNTLTTSYTDDILEVLHSMEKNMPINTVFVSMTINQDGLIYNTRATDMATVAKLIQQMKKVPYFSTVTTTGFTLSEDVEAYKITTNENGEEVRETVGKVDLYDLSLTCSFKTPYEEINLNKEGE
ncbi:MAG: type pilus assembly protein PilM [Clostridiales bacterium]|nr:type pilus assembly protein PilM [Clostridiales bacterium]